MAGVPRIKTSRQPKHDLEEVPGRRSIEAKEGHFEAKEEHS
jgi:hypothetical protein